MKKRNFYSLVITAFVVSAYGFAEGQWMNSWVSQILGKEKIFVSIMVATSGLFGAIFFIVWGAISDNNRDRLGKRKSILISGLLITGILVIVFGFSKFYIICLILDGVLIGITSNMFHSTRKALVPDMTKLRERGRINSNVMILGGIGSIATYAFVIWGQRDTDGNFTELTHILVFVLTGVLLIGAAIMIFFTLEEPMEDLPPVRNWWHDVKKIFSIKELRQHKEFYRFFIAYLFPAMARYAYSPFLILYVQEASLGPTEVLIYSLMMGGGAALGPIIFPRISDRFGRKRIVLITLPCAVVSLIVLAFSEMNIWVLYIGMFFMNFFLEGANTTSETWSQDLVDEEARGKFLGIINLTSSAGQIPGVIIAGLFADQLGLWVVFVIAAIFAAISIPLYLRVPDYVIQKPHIDAHSSQ
ncbi:MAG: MFS transporter [Promethearchaeota archaeon]